MTELSGKYALLGRPVSKAGLLGLGLLALDALICVALVAVYLAGRSHMTTVLTLAGMSVPVQALLLLLIPPVRAVARETFAQCIRMKIAAAFIFLLLAALGIICTQIKGDGTLAGQVKTLLSYSTSVIGLLLSVVTIFLAAGLISNDIRDKTIFAVATKPLPRWQYVLGRWMGLVLLNVALLVPAMAISYGAAEYLRFQDSAGGTDVDARDRLAVETEVFTARTSIRPKPLEVDKVLIQRIEELKKDTRRFESILAEYKAKHGGNEDAALAGIEQEIRKQVLAGFQSAAPLPDEIDRDATVAILQAADSLPQLRLHWEFQDIALAGSEARGEGVVLGSPLEDKQRNIFRVRVRTTPQMVGQLTYGGPVRVNNLNGRVEAVARDSFWAQFLVTDSTRRDLAAFTDGAGVKLMVEPCIQVSYKGRTIDAKGDDTLRGIWVAVNPSTNFTYIISQDDPSNVPATMTFPASAVDDKGRMFLTFVNRSASGVNILQEDVSVMYRVGGFESNFARAGLLILLQVSFLAAVGLLASSFLSYPVACLTAFGLLPFAMMRDYLGESVAASAGVGVDIWTILGALILKVTSVLLPNLSSTSPSDALVAGLSFSWPYMGETAFVQIAVRTLIVLVIACAIFHRRELAQVQV